MRQERGGIDERSLGDAREPTTCLDVGQLRDVALVLRIERLQRAFLGGALLQDALRHNLVDLVGDEMWLQFEASVQPANERRLKVRSVDDLLEVLLARDDEPDLSLAL